MRLIGNILWLVFGGLYAAIGYAASSIALMITIVGIPFALQTLKLASLEIWPFGAEIRSRPGQPGCLSTIMNLLWFFIGGIWIFLIHIIFGFLLTITIIGIPFARQHFKLSHLALTPFGREIVYP